MYICICNPTTDTEIKRACGESSSLKELKSKLSICRDCRNCAKEIKDIYKKHSNYITQKS